MLAAQSFRAAAHIVLRDIVQEWNKLPWTWKVAANQLTIMAGEQPTAALSGAVSARLWKGKVHGHSPVTLR